jgi:SOS-response transcriptional repressor LexA
MRYEGKKKLNQVDFSAALGVTQASISQYESGRRVPDTTFLTKLCSVYNVNLTWLLTGEGEMYTIDRAREDHLIPHTVSIPIVASIAAGPAIEPVEDQPHQLIQVPVSLLTLPPPYWAFRVEGESMSPHIIQDDIVVLSRDWHSLDLHDRICGFRTPDGITLKKLMVQHRKKTAWLMPLNHSYQPQEYTRDTQDLTLIGVLVLLIRKYI